jgi:hypothetical protein
MEAAIGAGRQRGASAPPAGLDEPLHIIEIAETGGQGPSSG